MSFWIILPLVGCLAGLMAGLLGLGGGILVVSAMVYILRAQFGVLPHLQHIAVGTSFAVMIFTGISNAWAQCRSRAVRWDMFRQIVLGVILGTAVSGIVAPFIPERALRGLFILFLYFVILKMLSQKSEVAAHRPGRKTVFVAGSFIGLLSGWLGIGGGTITVPFLNYCGLGMRQSVGTSAVLTLPIAASGAATYLATGIGQADLPPHTWGFVYLPGFFVLAICTGIFAPVGAKIADRISPRALKTIFLILLAALSLDMTRHFLTGF